MNSKNLFMTAIIKQSKCNKTIKAQKENLPMPVFKDNL